MASVTNNLQVKPQGTLESLGLYTTPKLPTNSQAAGIQGTDGRAYTRQVKPGEMAVNQLNDMTNSNSAYMQNAARRGLETAARRGMGNSSIAAGAAQRSALEAATPIAMQDAQTIGKAQSENLGYLNQNLMQERDIQNRALWEMNTANAARDGNVALSQVMSDENQQRYRMFQENLAYEGEQRGLDRAHDFARADQGFGHDLGRMGSEYGYDLGRLGYGAELTSLENDRDYFRNIGRDNNQFSNQRYSDVLQYGLRGRDQTRQFLFDSIRERPDVDPNSWSGIVNFVDGEANYEIDSFLENFFGGGG